MLKPEILEKAIYSVSRLNSEARSLLEDKFRSIWVEGEISNFSAPYSGHWYFSLKDSAAQVRCAMFKGNQKRIGFKPKDGMHVLVRARVSLYENRGEYQLIAEDLEERGEGKLQRAFELLKTKLDAAGLFSPDHKKPIPTFPKQIGVITSATGAAIRDILTVLKRRHPCVPVIIYPSLVQGDTAAASIVKAIEMANSNQFCDVLILARGGGSLEDLWPFNEEILAHAIHKSNVPIISGVGHEVDFTICDFVADIRAPTPSAAAEIATPDLQELLQLLRQSQRQITRHMRHKIISLQQHIQWMQKHLQQQHPKRKLTSKIQQLDFALSSLIQLQKNRINILKSKVQESQARLQKQIPTHKIVKFRHELHIAKQHFQHDIAVCINHKKNYLAELATKLHALSPLATLQRGYSLVTSENGNLVTSSAQVKIADTIAIRLTDGNLTCTVTEKH